MSTPFHPLILELAEELDEKKLVLDEDRAQAWATRLAAHTDGEELAVHLAVLANRLGKQGAREAAAQLVHIAIYAFSAAAAGQIATAAGVEIKEAKKLTGWSADPTKKRTAGLQAPTAGAGLRRKK